MHTHALMEPLSAQWWQCILAVIFLISFIIALPLYWKPAKTAFYPKCIGILLLANTVIENIYSWQHGTWSLTENLPLHLCSVSGILSGLLFINYQFKWAEILYYWGLTGGIHSLLTPEFTHGADGYFFYSYFIGHGGLLLAVFYFIVHHKFRPSPGSWWRVFLITQVTALLIGSLNWILNSNYMYLCQPPIADNPLIVGKWPWYILIFEALAIVHFGLFYLPFRKRNNQIETPLAGVGNV